MGTARFYRLGFQSIAWDVGERGGREIWRTEEGREWGRSCSASKWEEIWVNANVSLLSMQAAVAAPQDWVPIIKTFSPQSRTCAALLSERYLRVLFLASLSGQWHSQVAFWVLTRLEKKRHVFRARPRRRRATANMFVLVGSECGAERNNKTKTLSKFHRTQLTLSAGQSKHKVYVEGWNLKSKAKNT